MKEEKIDRKLDSSFPEELMFRSDEDRTFISFKYIKDEQRFIFWTGRGSSNYSKNELIESSEAGYLDFVFNSNDNIVFSATIFTNVDDNCKLTDDEICFFLDNKMVRTALKTYIKNNINTTVIN
jgi:hypothetical protein